MFSQTVLFIEDSLDTVELVREYIGDIGLTLEHGADGEIGLERALENDYAVVLVDLNLPKLGGLEICRRLREAKPSQPIVILTARHDEVDRVLGLEIGADDYLAKPFSVRELLLRLKALLRRSSITSQAPSLKETEDSLSYDELTIDRYQRKVTLRGALIDLTATEYSLLEMLALHPGKAFSRHELVKCLRGFETDTYEHLVNKYVSQIRGKIEHDPENPKYIHTLRGVGYRFVSRQELTQG